MKYGTQRTLRLDLHAPDGTVCSSLGSLVGVILISFSFRVTARRLRPFQLRHGPLSLPLQRLPRRQGTSAQCDWGGIRFRARSREAREPLDSLAGR